MVKLFHTNGQFSRLSHEDPTIYIQNFLQINETYTLDGVNVDYVRLTLILFALLGEAKRWLISEPANFITTWDDLAQKFLIRVFPCDNTTKLRNDMLNIRHKRGENMYQDWE